MGDRFRAADGAPIEICRGLLWRAAVLLGIAFLAACAGKQPGSGSLNPGAPPQSVTIITTSAMTHTPNSDKDLAHPVVQSVIAQCEAAGGVHCRADSDPADVRSQFVQGEDKRVITYMELRGLEPERDYEITWRLFDPEGQQVSRTYHVLHIPKGSKPKKAIHFSFPWVLPEAAKWAIGRWRVEVTINGRVEGERTVDIVEPPAKVLPSVRLGPILEFRSYGIAA